MEPPYCIHSVFSIGSACAADYLLNDMYIRGYSSPFSWMNIDLATSLNFIKTRFKSFTETIYDSSKQRYIHSEFQCTEPDHFCYWIHHDLSSISVQQAIQRRCTRFLKYFNDPTTLLIYYDTHHMPVELYRTYIDPFLNLYNCKFLVISPDITVTTPFVGFQSESLTILYCSSTQANLRPILNYIYTFNIIPRDTQCDKEVEIYEQPFKVL